MYNEIMDFLSQWYLLIIIYLVIVILLLIISTMLTKHIRKLFEYVSFFYEKLNFLYIHNIWTKQDSIYRYKQSLEVLYARRRKVLNQGLHRIGDYVPALKGTKKDIEYLHELLGKQVFSQDVLVEADRVNDVIGIVCKISRYIKVFLYIITLGVGWIFVGRQKYC